MDTPTSYFFNLERSVALRKQMVCLRLPDGDRDEEACCGILHRLFRAESWKQYLQMLLQIFCKSFLSWANLTTEEASAAVLQMASGRASGFDGLPPDFLKYFWSVLGQDLLDVFRQCLNDGTLPASCRWAVLSLCIGGPLAKSPFLGGRLQHFVQGPIQQTEGGVELSLAELLHYTPLKDNLVYLGVSLLIHVQNHVGFFFLSWFSF